MKDRNKAERSERHSGHKLVHALLKRRNISPRVGVPEVDVDRDFMDHEAHGDNCQDGFIQFEKQGKSNRDSRFTQEQEVK
jgi:hypothetical protein